MQNRDADGNEGSGCDDVAKSWSRHREGCFGFDETLEGVRYTGSGGGKVDGGPAAASDFSATHTTAR